MPRVSVIIPTHNRRAMLLEAINSVLIQTFQDFEILVVDDGSTDGTREAVGNIPDLRVRYFYQKNAGRSAARNRGLAESRGEFVAFLDDDDLFLPHKLEVQVRELDADPEVGLVVGGWQKIDEKGNVLEEIAPKFCALDPEAWLLDCPFIIHAPLVREIWVERASGFDRDFEPNEDWGFWLWLAHAGCRMKWIEGRVCCYRIYSGNSMPAYVSRLARSRPMILDKFFAQTGRIPETILGQRGRFYARAYLTRAFLAMRFNEGELANCLVRQAIEACPDWVGVGSTEFMEIVVGVVSDGRGDEPEKYLSRIVELLPIHTRRKQTILKRLEARLYMREAYCARHHGDGSVVRRRVVGALTRDPAWFLNRGVVVMLVESFVGGPEDSSDNNRGRR